MSENQIEVESPSPSALFDPLLSNFEMPLLASFHPLGYSVEIATNSQEVISCAEESFGHFKKVFPAPVIRVEIGVLDGGSEDCPPIPVCRARDNILLTMADPDNFTVCDLRRGFGFGWITKSALADRAFFRYYLLEGLVWTLVKSSYLTPLHAAFVKQADRGVLLCGDPGAGKSSLAFACARSGWTFLSDDSGSLIRDRDDRLVMGNPYQMRFREESTELFPELKDQIATPRLTGELSIELHTESMPEITTALMSPVDYIVFLNRREPDPPCLASFSKETALSWFESVICYGEKDLRDAQKESLRRLLEVPIFELRYRDLDWAVKRLEALVTEGA